MSVEMSSRTIEFRDINDQEHSPRCSTILCRAQRFLTPPHLRM